MKKRNRLKKLKAEVKRHNLLIADMAEIIEKLVVIEGKAMTDDERISSQFDDYPIMMKMTADSCRPTNKKEDRWED